MVMGLLIRVAGKGIINGGICVKLIVNGGRW